MTYDVIVLGVGGVGSATLDHLARRGLRVLGLDRFPPGHDRGSSHGRTRIIRQAYFEHPNYVPLLRRAYELWHELEQRTQQKLFYRVGLLEIGPPDGILIPGVLRAAEQHHLPLELLSRSDVANRWRGAFQLPDGYRAVFEAEAGYLDVEQCVCAQALAAQRAGAELRIGESVVDWKATKDGVEVRTATSCFRGGKLVVAAGAWAPQLLSSLQVPLVVRRKALFWLGCEDERYQATNGCPTFFYETADGAFYGFPMVDSLGVKAAEHSGGQTVADPLQVDRTLNVDDLSRVRSFMTRYLPGVSSEVREHAVCLYTMSPDEHFLLDRHPDHDNVVFAVGLSGHGFKFTTVLGEILADLATDRRATPAADFLSVSRFASRVRLPHKNHTPGTSLR